MENTTEKTVKTTKQKVWFGVRIALNVVFYAIILLVLLFSISNINAKNKKDRIPNIFGMGYLNVLTDSMDGDFDNSFKPGDMIIVKIANEDRIADLKVGDVVTFYDVTIQTNAGASSALDTHRIVFISEKGVYYTVGDKAMKISGFDITTLTEENCSEKLLQTFGYGGFQAFTADYIRGIYSSKWTGFGKVIKTVNDHFVPIVIVPIGALLLLEIGYLIYNIMKVREEKIKKTIQPQQDAVITDDDKEKLKAELRAQLLAEMGVSAEAAAKAEESAEPQQEQTQEAPVQEETEATSEEVKAEENEETPVEETPAEEPAAPQEEPAVETPAQEEPVVTPEETQAEEPVVEVPTDESAEPQEEPVQETPTQEETEATTEEKDEKPEEAEEKKPVKKAPAKKATSTKKTTTSKSTATAAKKPAATKSASAKASTTKSSTTKSTASKAGTTKASTTKAASTKASTTKSTASKATAAKKPAATKTAGTAKKTTTTAKKSTTAAKKPSTTKKTTAKDSK